METIKYGFNYKKEIDHNRWVNINNLFIKNNKIDWSNSVGCTVTFKYKNIDGELEIIGYNKINRKLKIAFKGKTFDMYTGHFIECKFGNLLDVLTSEFKIDIGQTFKDVGRDLTIIDRRYIEDKHGQNCKYYKCRCNKCSFNGGENYKNEEFKNEHWVIEANILKGIGCACCCDTPQITVPNINSIVAKKETHWMIPYFQGDYNEAKMYTPQSNQKVIFRCPDCGEVKDKKMSINRLYRTKSIGCRRCSDGVSYLSKYIHSILNQLNVDFQTEVKYDWNKYINPSTNKISQASIDFIIYHNGREIPLEVDGEWHRKDNYMNGQTKEHSYSIDEQRDKNCLKYLGEKTIRITDEGDIKENILNSKLNELFDLSVVNWNKCCLEARSSMMISVCEYWSENKNNCTTKNLADHFKLNRSTVIKYLKASSIGYDTKHELVNNAIKTGKQNSKKVVVYRNGVEYKIFDSVKNLCDKSEELFGVKLQRRYIYEVCNGKRKHHKGFTFKYVDTNKEEIA